MGIPYGHCHCGCGGLTSLWPYAIPAQGIRKGDPRLYIQRHGSIGKPKMTAEKFWAKVDKRGPDECWEWTGLKPKNTKFKYGVVMFQKKRQGTHRLAWKLTHGEIPEGILVLHKCDNPPCCNPNHLFLGTDKDNYDDMAAKGRQFIPPRGHKLTQEIADEIRHLYRNYGVVGPTLAKRFGVVNSLVYAILHDKIWLRGKTESTLI